MKSKTCLPRYRLCTPHAAHNFQFMSCRCMSLTVLLEGASAAAAPLMFIKTRQMFSTPMTRSRTGLTSKMEVQCIDSILFVRFVYSVMLQETAQAVEEKPGASPSEEHWLKRQFISCSPTANLQGHAARQVGQPGPAGLNFWLSQRERCQGHCQIGSCFSQTPRLLCSCSWTICFLLFAEVLPIALTFRGSNP